MTEATPLDPARVALIRDRLGAFLMEQPGAFETHDIGTQVVTREFLWNEDTQTIASPEQLAWLARARWSGQPLAGKLGEFYAVSIAAARVAERPNTRDLWHAHTEHAQTFLESTKSSPQVLPIIRSAFSDKKRETAKTLENSAAMIRRAAKALHELDQESEQQVDAAVLRGLATGQKRRTAQELEDVLLALANVTVSLWETTDEGLPLPRSMAQWEQFETTMAMSLLDLGVQGKRVTELFCSTDAADPEDERMRTARNVSRARQR